MKKLLFFSVLILLYAVSSCKKGNAENGANNYIAFFKKDSVANFIKPASLTDTAGIREKLKTYAIKIMKERSIPETSYKSSFYTSPTATGFILTLPDDKAAINLKSDNRIDSLHKSISFNGL